jgi:predicted RNA-binding Zn ribbon-like protein
VFDGYYNLCKRFGGNVDGRNVAENPVPAELSLIKDFVNTLEVDEDRDAVATPAEMSVWLRSHGLLSDEASITGEDHGRALDFREALRRLLLANNGGAADPADLQELDRLAAEAVLTPRFHLDGVRLEPGAAGIAGALGRLVAMVADAMAEGSWHRLKVCGDSECQWAFYDRSKNRSGHWCAMRVCGNRAKARQFRERRRNSAGPSST